MRWLIHGTLTPAVADALRRHGHTVQDPAAVGLSPANGPAEVLKAAHKAQLDLITNEDTLAATLSEPDAPTFGRSIVYLQLEGADVEQDDAIDRLFARYKRLNPGRLYTVTASRVKIRQLPGHP